MSEHLTSLDKNFKIRQRESPEQLRILMQTMEKSYQSERGTLKKDIRSKASQLKEQTSLIANLELNLQVTQTSCLQLKIVCLILATLVAASVTILLLTVH